jgi:CopG family nickel-responsive transcriptional regulator
LDHDNCLEVIVVRGKAKHVEKLANRLMKIKGVKHGRLTASTTGRTIR